MPVHGNHFAQRGTRHAARGLIRPAQQDYAERGDTADYVKSVRCREKVKEAGAGVGRKRDACRYELTPRDGLSRQEKDAENRGDAPPVAEALLVRSAEAGAGMGQGEAAGQQDGSVEP